MVLATIGIHSLSNSFQAFTSSKHFQALSKMSSSTDMDSIVSTLKSLDSSDLFKVMKQALSEAEKRQKSAAPRSTAVKKTGSMPKGIVPQQLKKPRAWVEFTLAHALEHGWEEFTVYQTRKDKATGEKIEEEIEMPGSMLHDGAHIYEGSVTDKCPGGKQLIHKDAMSLSKQRWAPKEKKGTHSDLYAEFEASYVDDTPDVSDTTSQTSSSKVVRKTAAEKEAEAAAKKLQKEQEKEAKKLQKEQEKEEKKLLKEQEKEEKKLQKEQEKEEKKKVPAKKGDLASVPAAAIKKVVAATAAPKKVAATAATTTAAPKKVAAKPAKDDWTCPADGMVHAWSYKGKQYLRNSDNEVWLRSSNGTYGDWQGIYLPAEDRIDDSVPEPSFEDEE